MGNNPRSKKLTAFYQALLGEFLACPNFRLRYDLESEIWAVIIVKNLRLRLNQLNYYLIQLTYVIIN